MGKIMRICTYSKNLTASCYTHIINGLNYYTFYNLYVHHCYNLQFFTFPIMQFVFPIKFCANNVFHFLLGVTVVP